MCGIQGIQEIQGTQWSGIASNCGRLGGELTMTGTGTAAPSHREGGDRRPSLPPRAICLRVPICFLEGGGPPWAGP